MLYEIKQMPEKAKAFLDGSPEYSLPLHVPYLGMGSSYFAPLAFKYMGIDIYPEMASEYFSYQSKSVKRQAVILSQSGRSSEALWCTSLFEHYIAITNDIDSPLSKKEQASKVIDLLAGEEKYSSSKTYINTLLSLFKGFNINVSPAMEILSKNMQAYSDTGEQIANKMFELIRHNTIHGIYITGSGPNIATASQAALILSESTKISFQGLPMAQYDHGPKETAEKSIVINILSKGPSYDRTRKLAEKIAAAGAHVFTVEEPEVEENASVLNNIIPFNFMCYFLAERLNIRQTFVVGGKVTEVDK